MLSHERLLSYYMAVNELMFRPKAVFSQNMSLTEIENMLPYEFELFVIHVKNSIDKYNAEHNNQ